MPSDSENRERLEEDPSSARAPSDALTQRTTGRPSNAGNVGGPVDDEPRTGTCRIELYGVARIASGLRHLHVEIGEGGDVESVLRSLAERCPALVGPVIRPDLTGLVEGHVLNLNGLSFVADVATRVAPGDTLLLLSSSAGG